MRSFLSEPAMRLLFPFSVLFAAVALAVLAGVEARRSSSWMDTIPAPAAADPPASAASSYWYGRTTNRDGRS
jgi:hypothetical protein